VATGKAERLVASGGRVRAVAPEVGADLVALEGPAVEIVRRTYRAGEAGGYDLVVTATGVPEVDRRVVADATAGKALVNSADRAAPGTVDLPAVHRDGPVTVAVSTRGASPALARWLRSRVAASVPAGVAELAALIDDTRSSLRAAGRPTESVDWDALLDGPVVALVGAGRLDEARAVLRSACGLAGPG
jgi:siroheme synthase-like protein